MASKKSSTNISDNQLTLFDPSQFTDDKPLPEIIAERYGFPLQFQDDDGIRKYAVPDWIAGVAQTENPRRFWSDQRRRAKKAGFPELYASCVQLKYLSADGKKYRVDFADAETLYVITANMDKTTGLRQQVIHYLAKSGVKMDEFRRDPGKMLDAGAHAYLAKGADPEWIARRAKGAVTRNEIMDTLREVVVGLTQGDYATFTNVEYQGLFKRTAAQIRKATGAKRTRDGMTAQALGFVQIAEDTCNDMLRGRELVDFAEACHIMSSIASALGLSVEAINKQLGVDIATGLPLLGGDQ